MVFDFLKRGAVEVVAEKKASATGSVVAVQTSGRVAWSPRDVVSLTRSGFCGNPVGFRSVKLIAEAAAALPLVLQDAAQRFEAHPLLDLVARPNGAQGRAELLEALYAQLLLTGNGYIEAVGAGPVPVELHVLRSDRMSVVPGADGWPVAYEYAVGGRKHRFDVAGDTAAICHIKNFHPQDDHYGFSPLQAAAMALDVHGAASRWSKALLDNAARPSGAIVYRGAEGQGKLSDDQYDRLVSEMESHHQGARNAAGRRVGLEADGVFALGHGVSPHQGGGGAGSGAGFWGAADAAGDRGGCDLCQLSGGASGVLPADGPAFGHAGCRGAWRMAGGVHA